MHCMQRAPICQGDEYTRDKVKTWNSFLIAEGDEKQPYSKQLDWKIRGKAKSARSPNVCIWLDYLFFFFTTAQQKGNVLVLPFIDPILGCLILIPSLSPSPYTHIISFHKQSQLIMQVEIMNIFFFRLLSWIKSQSGLMSARASEAKRMEAGSSPFISSKPPDCVTAFQVTIASRCSFIMGQNWSKTIMLPLFKPSLGLLCLLDTFWSSWQSLNRVNDFLLNFD